MTLGNDCGLDWKPNSFGRFGFLRCESFGSAAGAVLALRML